MMYCKYPGQYIDYDVLEKKYSDGDISCDELIITTDPITGEYVSDRVDKIVNYPSTLKR